MSLLLLSQMTFGLNTLLGVIGGVIAYPFLRFSKAVNDRGFNAKASRPPGSVAEPGSAAPTCCSRHATS